MAVLHKYVPSSDNEGYYIYAAHDGSNITYQVSSLARRIIDKLDSCQVDEKLPAEVFYTLRQLEYIYTHQSGVDDQGSKNEIPTAGPPERLSVSERETFFDELLSAKSLEPNQRRIVHNYLRSDEIEYEAAGTHRNEWTPAPPNSDSYRGRVKRIFQDGQWGFVEPIEDGVTDDVFFHIDELDQMAISREMVVEFAFKTTAKGLQVTHMKPVIDDSGEIVENHTQQEPNVSRDDGTVGKRDLSEGNYIEAKVDHAKGKKGIGEDGYLHIAHGRGKGADYMYISEREEPVPVGKWVVVRITAVHQSHAEAKMEAAPPNLDPPVYMP